MKKFLTVLSALLLLTSLWAGTTITQQNSNQYRVLWEISDWELSSQGEFSTFRLSGFGVPDEPGAPLLPYDECKIAVPQDGIIEVSVLRSSSREMSLEKRLQPVPTIAGNGKTDEYLYIIDENLYAAAVREPITVLPQQRFRQLSFIPVRINPFIYDGQNSLQVISSIEFIVTIRGNLDLRNFTPVDELTELLAQQTINPSQALVWRTAERQQVNYADFARSDFWVRVDTDRDGMFKLTPTQLNMLPINDIDPRTFRMFTTGGEVHSTLVSYAGPEFREVPIYVHGENDGVFNASDYIIFYGRDRDGHEMNQSIVGNQFINPYSKNVSYWLTFGGSFDGSPKRISMASAETTWDTTASTTPATVRIEEEVYQRTPVGFEWFMGRFFGNSTAEYNYQIELEDLDSTQQQTFSMLLKQEYIRSGSDIEHRVRLKVNGAQLLNSSGSAQEWVWVGLSPITITHTGQYFAPGNNNILINVIRYRADNLFLDYYQVAYQKKLIKRSKQFMVTVPNALSNQKVRYDFTGSSSGVRVFKALVGSDAYDVTELPVSVVAGGFNFVGSENPSTRYFVVQDTDLYAPASVQSVQPINLAASNQPFDNIIITPPDYLQQANNLATFYSQNFNKKSKVVLLQDIFNQFNAGMPDPNAVRLFLKNAVQNYPEPAITTLTLLGSGTNDWRNFSGQSATKNKIIVFQKGTTTTDDYFGMLNTVQYPELAIGRYPVRTQNELNIMLSNLDKYVTEPSPGIWRNSLIFLADDEYNGPTTGEYSHSEQLQDTSNYINKSILIDKIFALEYEFDEFQNKPAARDDMMAAINAGKLIWYYIGHGSFDTLGAEDYFKGALDMGRFNNPDKLTLFVAASCDVAQYDSFSFDSLAEKVVLVDNAAAIASIAATRECNGPSNVALLKQYYHFSLNLRNPIGYSLVMAKIVYTAYNTNDEKYNILGDPLLLIASPERDSTIAILTDDFDNVFNAREQINLQGQFPASGINNTASVQVFNCEIEKRMANNSPYTFRGRNLFRGDVTVTDSQYNSSFIVPDDVTTGSTGLIVTYLWDPLQKKDYVNYLSPVAYSDQSVGTINPDAPQIELYLDDMDFVSGDTVGSNPLLIAYLSDQNGINITNSPGHSILLIIDQTVALINVTDLFSYDKDSFTSGSLTYQLSGLSEGSHKIQLIAFDNFNRPSVASIDFLVRKSKSFTIEDFLPYPNPMKKSGYFTFRISEPADVKLTIYTIRGRKIKTIDWTATKDYNQIPWDGRDADGDYLANNTYFIKLTARALSGIGKAEKTEKLVIYN